MRTGIDDQPDCPPDIRLKPPIVVVWILIEADLLTEPLTIERPALRKGRVIGLFSKLRQSGKLLRDRDLQVMSWNAFVVRNSFHRGQRPFCGVVCVHVHATGPFTIRTSLVVVRRSLVLFDED